MLISLTRLRLRSWRDLGSFLKLSGETANQAAADESCLAAATYLGPWLTFWTATAWVDEASMRNYVLTGAHRISLPKLSQICSEAATSRYEASVLPTRHELLEKLAAAPRFVPVRNPSVSQIAKFIPARRPWLRQIFKPGASFPSS